MLLKDKFYFKIYHMIFLILLTLISINQSLYFSIAGITTNMSDSFYQDQDNCTFDTCPKMICDILGGTTYAYVVLSPSDQIKLCPKIPMYNNVNMVSFIFDQKGKMTSPFTCNTIGNCVEKGCNNYLTSKNSMLIAFTGQCF